MSVIKEYDKLLEEIKPLLKDLAEAKKTFAAKGTALMSAFFKEHFPVKQGDFVILTTGEIVKIIKIKTQLTEGGPKIFFQGYLRNEDYSVYYEDELDKSTSITRIKFPFENVVAWLPMKYVVYKSNQKPPVVKQKPFLL